MVRGDNHQVARAEQLRHFLQPSVKFLQCAGKSLRVVPVAVYGIRIHQVGKAQPVKVRLHKADQCVHAGGVSRGMVDFRQSLMGKNILNLAYADGLQPCLHHGLRQGPPAGRHGEIPPVSRAFETSGFSQEGAGNHPAHTQLSLQHLPGNPAEFIQLFRRKQLLMAGNLENAVPAGIDNGCMIPQVRFPQLLDDRRSGCRLVADAFVPDGFLVSFHEFPGKPVRESRESLRHANPGNLPVSGGGILSLALLQGPPPGAGHRPVPFVSGGFNISQAHCRHIGQAGVACFNHMAQRVGTRIPVFRRIRRLSRAYGIQHRQKNPAHSFRSFSFQVVFSFISFPFCLRKLYQNPSGCTTRIQGGRVLSNRFFYAIMRPEETE